MGVVYNKARTMHLFLYIHIFLRTYFWCGNTSMHGMSGVFPSMYIIKISVNLNTVVSGMPKIFCLKCVYMK